MRVVAGIAAAVSLVLVAGIAAGQDNPIQTRQQLMKANNAAARSVFGMVSGKTDYDAKTAADAMNQIASDMEQFVTLFPEGSDGAGSEASPDVWTNFDDFKALAAKAGSDAKAAAEAAPNGVDAFKTAFSTLNGDCMACHRKYRAE
jgi:cytochrome c556